VSHPALPLRAQSIKGKLRAELEEALNLERQMLLAQSELDDVADATGNSSDFPAKKIMVVEDVPWQTFIEDKFGAKVGMEMKELGRASAVHIQRVLRGYLVRITPS
jgi:CRISPR/Cas system CSM-associated protein Csm3 (group 7 of RAMP superfamily)